MHQQVYQKIKNSGYKLTKQRQAVLDVLLGSPNEHFSSEEIYMQVKQFFPDIGIATVYRTLLLFEHLDIIFRLDIDDNVTRYDLVDDNAKHKHHHLICVNCNKVIEVEGDLLDDIEEKITQKYDFSVSDHMVKFYGLCSECKK